MSGVLFCIQPVSSNDTSVRGPSSGLIHDHIRKKRRASQSGWEPDSCFEGYENPEAIWGHSCGWWMHNRMIPYFISGVYITLNKFKWTIITPLKVTFTLWFDLKMSINDFLTLTLDLTLKWSWLLHWHALTLNLNLGMTFFKSDLEMTLALTLAFDLGMTLKWPWPWDDLEMPLTDDPFKR